MVTQRWNWYGRAAGAALLLALAACVPSSTTGAPTGPAPRLPEIMDGTSVRVRGADTIWAEGLAARFGTAAPVVVRTEGGTVAVTCAEELQVLQRTSNRGIAGALTGLVVAGAVQWISCSGRKYCGEEDPTPALAAIAGYFIGRQIRTRTFVNVERPECPAIQSAPHASAGTGSSSE